MELKKETFICLDCEATGLDTENDRICEIAVAIFTLEKILKTFETLVNPQKEMPKEIQAIHNISNEMVQNSPTIDKVLPSVFELMDGYTLMGHGITFDLSLISQEAKRYSIPFTPPRYIDTLRLARLYGESPTNSLEALRLHFNIPFEGAHRAMSDVLINIEVFKHLSSFFKTTEAICKRLEQPILLKNMPLGKYKGRKFSDVPIEYLKWALHKDFDQDLMFSIKTELKRRKEGSFSISSNPFADL